MLHSVYHDERDEEDDIVVIDDPIEQSPSLAWQAAGAFAGAAWFSFTAVKHVTSTVLTFAYNYAVDTANGTANKQEENNTSKFKDLKPQ